MNGSFTPFAPATSGASQVNGRSFSLKICSQPAANQAFAPFKPVAGLPAHGAAAPAITLQREGDRIKRITIQCGCGQVIELECLY
ncbi:MAG: hypothetical protein AAB676_08615 [Verrucomicrobiota bacterium]